MLLRIRAPDGQWHEGMRMTIGAVAGEHAAEVLTN